MKAKTEYKGLSKDQMGSMKEHWEHHYCNEPTKDTPKRTGSEFVPKKPKQRMTTHVKVNETDT